MLIVELSYSVFTGMSDSNPDHNTEIVPSPELDDKHAPKKSIGKIFGYEISAPAEMKSPALVLFGMIFVNFLLLILLRKLISP